MGHKLLFLILTELKGKGLESGKLNLFICTPFFHIYTIWYLSLASCSHFNMSCAYSGLEIEGRISEKDQISSLR